MQIDLAATSAADSYRLMSGLVVPRPVTWVSSLGDEGQFNSAPFSTFTYVTSCPAHIAFTIGTRNGQRKDTANNILRLSELFAHIADLPLLDAAHRSSAELPPQTSEAEHIGLSLEPSLRIRVPRVGAAPVTLEWTLERVLVFEGADSQMLFGNVLVAHVRDALYQTTGIDSKALQPICHLGGPCYARIGDVFRMTPPELLS